MTEERVLLLEDNEIDRDLYQIAFEQIENDLSVKFHITFISSFNELNELIQKDIKTFSFAIFDLIINKEKSLPYISKIKEKFSTMPLIVLSSSAYEDDINQSYEAGATDFSMKPISITSLCDLLKKIHSTYC